LDEASVSVSWGIIKAHTLDNAHAANAIHVAREALGDIVEEVAIN
jgi:hypothetical protein